MSAEENRTRPGEGVPGAMHFPPGAGRAYWLAMDLHTFKTIGEDTGGSFSLSEVTAAPQSGPPPHIHHREDETYYVLEGEFEFIEEAGEPATDPSSPPPPPDQAALERIVMIARNYGVEVPPPPEH